MTAPHEVSTATPAVVDASAAAALRATWTSYRRTFIKDGRVIDPRTNNNTTSEGQSYALLRAVWLDDRATFDAVWAWTHEHLWQEQSQRIAWSWDAAAGAIASQDSATDGDEDIALALVFAAARWRDVTYTRCAERVLQSVWSNDVVVINGTPYLVAGNWAANPEAGPVLNPSYFAPYAYRIFAGIDTSHPWMSLVGSSYAALNACSRSALGGAASAGLPPNWCVLDAGSGQAHPFADKPDGTEYGYDAFRVMWRVALDEQWFGAAPARAYLATQQFLRQQWRSGRALAPIYAHDGSRRATYDDPTIYGGDIGAFIDEPADATALLHKKLLPSLSSAGGDSYWGDRDNYYAQNWVWFGVALVTGGLSNLAAGR